MWPSPFIVFILRRDFDGALSVYRFVQYINIAIHIYLHHTLSVFSSLSTIGWFGHEIELISTFLFSLNRSHWPRQTILHTSWLPVKSTESWSIYLYMFSSAVNDETTNTVAFDSGPPNKREVGCNVRLKWLIKTNWKENFPGELFGNRTSNLTCACNKKHYPRKTTFRWFNWTWPINWSLEIQVVHV